MNVTAWASGLEVTGDGTGIVSHAGLGLLRRLATVSHGELLVTKLIGQPGNAQPTTAGLPGRPLACS